MKDDDDQHRVALRPSHHRDDEAFKTIALRWSLAVLCVALFYGGGVYAAINWLTPTTATVELPAAIMIEMSSVAEAPDTSQQDVALGPTMEMSQAATPAEQQDKTDEPQPDVQPEMKTEIEAPLLPEKKTEAVLAQPVPSDPAQQTSKPQRKPERPKSANSKPETRASQNTPVTAAPQAADARASIGERRSHGRHVVIGLAGKLAQHGDGAAQSPQAPAARWQPRDRDRWLHHRPLRARRLCAPARLLR